MIGCRLGWAGMEGQHDQYRCAECDRLTLHIREVVEFNHIPHLLITLLFVGFWLPIWLLCAISHNKYPGPYRCEQCGHAHGTPTVSEQLLIASRRKEQVKEAHEKWQAEQRLLNEAKKANWDRLVWVVRTGWIYAGGFPDQVDRLLELAAGPGNTILFRFFEVVVATTFLIAFALAWFVFLVWALE